MKKIPHVLFKFMIFIIVLFSIILVLTSPKKIGLTKKNGTSTINSMLSKKEGIYVFGFDECPWCRELYPILDKSLTKENLSANLVDTHGYEIRNKDKYKLKKFIVNNSNYDDIVVPIIFFISKNGLIQIHVGTINEHDAINNKLTNDQKHRLESELTKNLIIYKQNNN